MTPGWEEFVTLHAQAVLDSALRVVANSADAEDVAQDVFMEILQSGKLSKFTGQPALLRTMAIRRALDRLRRRKPEYAINDREPVARGHEPYDYAVAAELDLQLQMALANLPGREAEVFCLSVLEGNSAGEISSLLKISKGAVAKALCMARTRISAAFNESNSRARK